MLFERSVTAPAEAAPGPEDSPPSSRLTDLLARIRTTVVAMGVAAGALSDADHCNSPGSVSPDPQP